MKDKIQYLFHLADNALILGHRNSEWCGHGPVLEQDIAITNISLDLIGQARNFYQYAAQLLNEASSGEPEVTEDTLAYLRDAPDFRNCLLVEQPRGDWAQTILRQFFFSNYQYWLYEQLQHSADEQIAAIAGKAFKEVTYHLRWSSEWVIRLGDGTEESKRRMQEAINNLWSYTAEFFIPAGYETEKLTVITMSSLREKWNARNLEIFTEASLVVPVVGEQKSGGKQGNHSEHLETILAELQVLQRTYPDAQW